MSHEPSSGANMDVGLEEEVILYHDPDCFNSLIVAMSLKEKHVPFLSLIISSLDFENYDDSFLSISPDGALPMIKRGSRTIADDQDLSQVLRYIDMELVTPSTLFPSHCEAEVESLFKCITDLPMDLIAHSATTVLASQHQNKKLRHPFHSPDFRMKCQSYNYRFLDTVKQKSEELAMSGRIFQAQSLNRVMNSHCVTMGKIMQDYSSQLRVLENCLDRVEKELSKPHRKGLWIFGDRFTAADIALTMLLYRIYQIGLDSDLVLNGVRPYLSVYQTVAFERPSFQRSVQWSEHQLEESTTPGNTETESESYGWQLGAMVALGAAYIAKKVFFR